MGKKLRKQGGKPSILPASSIFPISHAPIAFCQFWF